MASAHVTEVNQTKIKGGCQSGRKVVTHNSKRDLPLELTRTYTYYTVALKYFRQFLLFGGKVRGWEKLNSSPRKVFPFSLLLQLLAPQTFVMTTIKSCKFLTCSLGLFNEFV